MLGATWFFAYAFWLAGYPYMESYIGMACYASFILIGAIIYNRASNRAHANETRYANDTLKMYCICSKEALDQMKGIRGKMITQGGHAYGHAIFDAMDRFPNMLRAYRASEKAFKITLVVPTEKELIELRDRYHEVCGVSLVKDAGLTVFKNEDGSPKPTITYLGIGPLPDSLKGQDLKDLKTLT